MERIKNHMFLILLFTIVFAQSAQAMTIGTNIGGVKDYSSSWFFIDAYQMSREWLTRTVGGDEWDSGMRDEIPVDQNGWPTHVPFTASGTQHYVHTLLPTLVNGEHTLIIYGTGEVEIDGVSFTATGGRNEFTYDVTNADPTEHTYVLLEVHESVVSDPINSIKFILPGFTEAQSDQDIFHPLFLESLQAFSTLRYMDMQQTNFQTVSSWSERTPAYSYTQARSAGVSFEKLIALANIMQKNPWFCIPERADDNYIRQMAQLLRDEVDPDLKIYLEYSNEVWNGIFTAESYANQQGSALGYSLPYQHFYAHRSGRIWEIFEEEFSDDARFVRVIAGQSVNPWHEEQILDGLNDLSINPGGIKAEATSIAPYFGTMFSTNDPVPTLNEIFNTIIPGAITYNIGDIEARRDMLETNNLILLAYEGGQHFVGIQGAENNDALTDRLLSANRDPRMYDAYIDYLTRIDNTGLMNTFAHYSHCSSWSKWGSWGALEYQTQPLTEAPKHRALLDFIASTSSSNCPNTQCEPQHNEDCTTCPEDRGDCPVCGDGTCDAGEDCTTCPEDCGECQCIHDADNNPCDGVVSTEELSAYINEWKAGTVNIQDLMGGIVEWKK